MINSVLSNTDGSCWYGDTPEAAVASWAIIFDHCESQNSQIDIATNWSCPNTWPSSLQLLKAGGIPGRQSNDRAELFAVFMALTVAPKIHIYSDSKYALDTLDDIVNNRVCLWKLAKRTNWGIICKLVAAVGTRGNTSLRWTHVKAHQELNSQTDPITKYHQLGNSYADHCAKDFLQNLSKDISLIPLAIHQHIEFFIGLWRNFATLACAITRLLAKHSSSTGTSNGPTGKLDQVREWNPVGPVQTFVCEADHDLICCLPHPPTFVKAIALWLSQLSWPTERQPQSVGIAWLELMTDFMLSTGIPIPVSKGKYKKYFRLFMPTSADQLIETPLADQLKHFRSCIKGLATISQRPTLPTCYTSRCQSLLLYPGGRETCGFEVRPKLVCTERVINCMKQFHERGSGLRVDMSHPCLLFDAVADSNCEERIRLFEKTRERIRTVNRRHKCPLAIIQLITP